AQARRIALPEVQLRLPLAPADAGGAPAPVAGSGRGGMTFDAAQDISSGAYTWAGRRVLVTGGAGFVGGYLVEDLLAQGADVRVVDDFSADSQRSIVEAAEVELISGDLRDPEVARRSVAGIEVVLHL